MLRTSQPGKTRLVPHTPSTLAGKCHYYLLLLFLLSSLLLVLFIYYYYYYYNYYISTRASQAQRLHYVCIVTKQLSFDRHTRTLVSLTAHCVVMNLSSVSMAMELILLNLSDAIAKVGLTLKADYVALLRQMNAIVQIGVSLVLSFMVVWDFMLLKKKCAVVQVVVSFMLV